MTRILSSLRLLAALLALSTIALCLSVAAGPTGAVDAGAFTPLPAGWELCILQGVNAPATQANVDDLDAWQAGEGGSTNNTAAYNPFNTLRTTDVNNNPVPEQTSSNGFPAYANWQAGCAATVATVEQPNMAPITAALVAGNVSPPGAFLATVDQSQWCAPSNGVPCYFNAIVGAAGSVSPSILADSSALSVFSNVQTDMKTYETAAAAVAANQNLLESRDVQLATAETKVASSRGGYNTARRALRGFSVQEYVSTGLYDAATLGGGDDNPRAISPQTANGVVAQVYNSLIGQRLVGSLDAAKSHVQASLSAESRAKGAVKHASAVLLSDQNAEKQSLARLVSDVATMQEGGACTNATLTVSTGDSPTPAPATSTPTTATTTTTTTPLVSSAGPSATTTSSTTTSTSTTTTSTSTTLPGLVIPVVPSSTSTTTTTTPPTTAPPSTTTTTTTPAPSSTTTTTTAPAAAGASGTGAAANPAGLLQLAGCVAALTPASA